MSAQVLGLATLVIMMMAPAFAFFWRSQRVIFFFATALIGVGIGYLATTNAPADVARFFYGEPDWIDYGALGDA